MDYQNIQFEYRDGVARLTLNRPEKLNAFCDAMFPEIGHALDSVEADPELRVLVITGAGRGFCAGADLDFPLGSSNASGRDVGATLERNYNPLILRLRALPVPVVTAVNGVAAGAGASLALAGDIVIAAKSASFILAFARIGLLPDAGATYFLPQAIGTARAMGLAMLGEKVGAEEAAQWGLIWKCVDDAEFANAVAALTKHLANAPTRALAATKQALYASERQSLAQQLALERQSQKALGETSDFEEGVTAFREKRKAVFQGK